MKATPDTKLKRPMSLILNGETVQLFRHEKGLSSCTVILPDGTPEVADLSELEIVGKERKGLVAKPKVLTKVEKTAKDELNDFFDEMALVMPFNCMECGKPLYAYTKFAQRACTCHILPKAQFPTIATNVHNIVFMGPDLLGICDDHDSWDKKGVEHRKTMKVYTEAVESFTKYLRKELNDKDLVAACEYLGIDWQ